MISSKQVAKAILCVFGGRHAPVNPKVQKKLPKEKKIWSRVGFQENKACAVLVSASVSLLAAQIQLEKEPPWLRQGGLGWG